MIKYGQALTNCKICCVGICLKTQVDRDSKWEYNILKTSCKHFDFVADIFTSKEVHGASGEINFCLKAICKICKRKLTSFSSSKNWNFLLGDSLTESECHGNEVRYFYEYAAYSPLNDMVPVYQFDFLTNIGRHSGHKRKINSKNLELIILKQISQS